MTLRWALPCTFFVVKALLYFMLVNFFHHKLCVNGVYINLTTDSIVSHLCWRKPCANVRARFSSPTSYDPSIAEYFNSHVPPAPLLPTALADPVAPPPEPSATANGQSV